MHVSLLLMSLNKRISVSILCCSSAGPFSYISFSLLSSAFILLHLLSKIKNKIYRRPGAVRGLSATKRPLTLHLIKFAASAVAVAAVLLQLLILQFAVAAVATAAATATAAAAAAAAAACGLMRDCLAAGICRSAALAWGLSRCSYFLRFVFSSIFLNVYISEFLKLTVG